MMRLFLVVMLTTSSFCMLAQERVRLLAAELGTDFVDCRKLNDDNLRELGDDYDLAFGLPHLQSQLTKVYAGLKVEMRSRNDFMGLATGLRFTHATISVYKNGAPDFFYFRGQQSGSTTDYFRVKEIDQVSDYLGVPLEFRVFAVRQRLFRLYFTAGAEMDYRLGTHNAVDFENPAMKAYESEVTQNIKSPARWTSSFYTRAGFTIGKEKPVVSIGITLPVIMTRSAGGIATPSAGGGFQIQLQRQF